jgi:TorA maturation chaperone TorD
MSLAAQISPCNTNSDADLDLAREVMYRFFAAIFRDPRGRYSWLSVDAADLEMMRRAAEILRDELGGRQAPLGLGELPAENLDIEPVLNERSRSESELNDEYVRVFGLVTSRECPPYETEYCANEDTFFRTQQMADVAGFYQAFGLQVSADQRERPDFLPLELEFAALLLMKKRLASAGGLSSDTEHARVCDEARLAFFRDHLCWWAPSFTLGLRRKATHGIYYEAGRAFAAFLPIERGALGLAAPTLPILQPAPAEHNDSCEGCQLGG